MRKSALAALATGAAVTTIIVATRDAQAGAFALREQSAIGQGSSFAGVAAGGAPSSMFWNPATMTQFYGLNFESDISAILPKVDQTGVNNTPSFLQFSGGLTNTGKDALVPASYTTWQLSDRFWVGLSVNAPFGLSVGFERPNWGGWFYAQNTYLKTYNATPSVAIKITDWFSIGAGLQIQYAKADLNSASGVVTVATPAILNIHGTGWAWGWTAGATFTPTPTTQIGVGWRSQLDQDIDGTVRNATGFQVGVDTTLKLPDVVSAGIRQRLTDRWMVMGTVEWSHWSRIGTATINGSNALFGTNLTLPFQYSDGWFYSIGTEYIVNPRLTLRTGFGFETSPITDNVRTPRLPDNDRYWASVGFTHAMTERLKLDVGYSYIWLKDTHIDITAASGNPWFSGGQTYVGDSASHIHIFSLGVRYQLYEPPKPVITKG